MSDLLQFKLRSYQGSMWWHIQPDWWWVAISKKKGPLLCTGKKSKILSESVRKNNTIVKTILYTIKLTLRNIFYSLYCILNFKLETKLKFFRFIDPKSICINTNLNPNTEIWTTDNFCPILYCIIRHTWTKQMYCTLIIVS